MVLVVEKKELGTCINKEVAGGVSYVGYTLPKLACGPATIWCVRETGS